MEYTSADYYYDDIRRCLTTTQYDIRRAAAWPIDFLWN